MRDSVSEVKSKIDIVDIISEYVDLKKAGSNWKGVCPFHSEKTPSFMVNPELQIFKCFGCSESGDVFTFLEKYEGMEFYETLKYLAEKTGVVLEHSISLPKNDKEKLYEVANLAHHFYQYMLFKHVAGKPALSYLNDKRGLSLDTITAFEIGFAPNDFSALTKVLIAKKKTTSSELEKVGLCYLKNGRPIDRFRGRVMFPVHDHRGNLCGFSGRILPELDNGETGKYINSPETILHHKGSLLFGLWQSRKEIKRVGFAVLVEGPMDAIASWQGGVKNVVAIQGTSLTQEQVKLLSRFTKKIIFCLDSDFAGVGAERRGILLAEAEGLEVRVARLSNFKDPGEAAIQDPKAYKKAIADSVGVWDFLIDSIIGKYNVIDGTNKAKISRELAPLLKDISDEIVRAHYISEVARRLLVPEEAVLSEINRKQTPRSLPQIQIEPQVQVKKTRRENLEEKFISLAFAHNPSYLLTIPNLSEMIVTPAFNQLVESFILFSQSHKNAQTKEFAETLSPSTKDFFENLLLKSEDNIDIQDTKEYNTQLHRLFGELELLIIRSQLDQLVLGFEGLKGSEKQKRLLQAQKKFQKMQKLQSQLEEK